MISPPLRDLHGVYLIPDRDTCATSAQKYLDMIVVFFIDIELARVIAYVGDNQLRVASGLLQLPTGLAIRIRQDPFASLRDKDIGSPYCASVHVQYLEIQGHRVLTVHPVAAQGMAGKLGRGSIVIEYQDAVPQIKDAPTMVTVAQTCALPIFEPAIAMEGQTTVMLPI